MPESGRTRPLPSLLELDKAARAALAASDVLSISSERWDERSARVAERRATLRTYDALRQTRSMLEQAAAVLQRARCHF